MIQVSGLMHLVVATAVGFRSKSEHAKFELRDYGDAEFANKNHEATKGIPWQPKLAIFC
jgi:hypothetical protein